MDQSTSLNAAQAGILEFPGSPSPGAIPTAAPVATPQAPGTPVPAPAVDPREALWPEGHPSEPTPQPGQPAVQPPKQDQTRYEYWQREADQRRLALEQAQSRLSQFEALTPLLSAIESNPRLRETIEKELMAPQQPGINVPGVTEVTRPQFPTKPANYNPNDAITDPTSESAKYLQATVEYNEKLAQYNDHVSRQQEAARQQAIMRQQEEQMYRQQIGEVYSTVQQRHGLKPHEAQAFVQFMSSPESISLENMVRYWKAVQGQGMPAQAPAPQRGGRAEFLPPAALTGASQQTQDDETSFNLGLIDSAKRRF